MRHILFDLLHNNSCKVNCNTILTALIWNPVFILPHFHSVTFNPQLTPYYVTMLRNILHGFIKQKHISYYVTKTWLEGWLGAAYVVWHQRDNPTHFMYMQQCSTQKSGISANARTCMKRNYTRKQIYIYEVKQICKPLQQEECQGWPWNVDWPFVLHPIRTRKCSSGSLATVGPRVLRIQMPWEREKQVNHFLILGQHFWLNNVLATSR